MTTLEEHLQWHKDEREWKWSLYEIIAKTLLIIFVAGGLVLVGYLIGSV
jgi:hypothetical protein